MATSAIYRLAKITEREESVAADEDVDEGWFETGGRTPWSFTLQLQRIDAGATLEVVIESSPNADPDQATELVSFGSQTDTTNDPVEKTGIVVDAGEEYIRARTKTLTGGKAFFGVTATSAFFSPASDTDLLNQALRELNTTDRTRIVEHAEADVVGEVIGVDELGKLEADLARDDALGRIKRAIARQARHLYQKEQLEQKRDASALVTLREMGEIADGMDGLLDPILDTGGLTVWRGRGHVAPRRRLRTRRF